MIPKTNIAEINKEDIELLIKNAVPEGRTIEYKTKLPGGSDSEKKEFLADISSFANTTGGDIIYGVNEKDRIPTEIVGIKLGESDEEIGKLENIIRYGIEPRIQHSLQATSLSENNFLIIIRIKQSWIKPHRVIIKGHDKFYARNANGKYPLDVTELRTLFNLSQTVTERIQNFRIERALDLISNNTPIPMEKEAKLIIHLIPFESFTTKTNIDFSELNKMSQETDIFRPMGGSGWNTKINLNGIIAHTATSDQPAHSYIQLYRNGIIEAIRDWIVYDNEQGEKLLRWRACESTILEYLPKYLSILKRLNVNPPIVLFLSLVGVKNSKMSLDGAYFSHTNSLIEKDELYLPEVILENCEYSPGETLKPAFDLVWNACGLPGSLNFDKDGNLKK